MKYGYDHVTNKGETHKGRGQETRSYISDSPLKKQNKKTNQPTNQPKQKHAGAQGPKPGQIHKDPLLDFSGWLTF